MMMKLTRILFALSCILSIFLSVNAQPQKKLVTVVVTPNHPDWMYRNGEPAEFTISVFKNDIPLDADVKYTIRPEKMDILDEGTITLKKGSAVVKAKGMKVPGFLQCLAEVEVDGKKYSSYSTAGYEVDRIMPSTSLPDDFIAFWDGWKQKLAAVPVEPVLRLMPERCTDQVDVFHVSMKNIEGKIYGILCKPKKTGKYPAILHVPGAGVRPYYGDVSGAEKGFITLQIGIHGIPVNLDPGVYDDLRAGALVNYNQALMDDKNSYYYKRVYLGCVRAVDFIYGLDEFDGQNVAVTGGSQGGALSIITAGLDARIKYLAAFYPALSDLTGYLKGRAGGWPHLFQTKETQREARIETSKYYDVVNFARFVKVPGWYSWGFNDNVCPPTSIYAAYNVIDAPKELQIFQDTQHWTYPEQQEMRTDWLYSKLKK
ncbi:acetylxylan esterase [Gaoshiqia sp. Z1-71]|uniref:acetylxylan esterase n=1 Tax=Gaoshiqia hydrogeniformans TaxID=3290090 RepID=UPI003BF8051E